jgi:hypothetical protein
MVVGQMALFFNSGNNITPLGFERHRENGFYNNIMPFPLRRLYFFNDAGWRKALTAFMKLIGTFGKVRRPEIIIENLIKRKPDPEGVTL